ncbi:hypothetical protein ACFQ9X_28340 [Catenulispora yoronensis]
MLLVVATACTQAHTAGPSRGPTTAAPPPPTTPPTPTPTPTPSGRSAVAAAALSSLPKASDAELAQAPHMTVVHAYDLPAGWHVHSFGAWLDADYAVFEAVETTSDPSLDISELWIVRLSDGALREIPKADPASTIANDTISDGWITHLEKTPAPETACPGGAQAGCYSWKMYAIRASDGTSTLLAQSPHPQDQAHIPLVNAHDGLFAWQQTDDNGKTYAAMDWRPDTSAPVRLTSSPKQATVRTDGKHVYIEQSVLEKDGSRSDSVISVLGPDGTPRPIATYRGPCCADVKDGVIAYMTGDRSGDGAVSVAPSDQATQAQLTDASPSFHGFGIYTVNVVDDHHLYISTVKGDFLTDTQHPGTPVTITPDLDSMTDSHADHGLIANPVRHQNGLDTLFILSVN